MTPIEAKRQELQKTLDATKPLDERNRMGQYSTPYPLAEQICRYLKNYTGERIESFLEPAAGTGVFYSVLSENFKIRRSLGFEIDPHYHVPTSKLWQGHGIELKNMDFLTAEPTEKFSLIVSNPPYSRHHHISPERKAELAAKIKKSYGITVSGLSGLHAYFMILSSQWLKEGGYSCWLVPSEFLYVNYGRALKRFLLDKMDLISIHSFQVESVQFEDALVSSSVVLFRNSTNPSASVKFSWGEDINHPSKEINIAKTQLDPEKKWNEQLLTGFHTSRKDMTIGDFFRIKRGVATGDNKFFIIDRQIVSKYNIPDKLLTPVIPPPRKLKTDIYTSDNSTQDSLYLITCDSPIDYVKTRYEGFYRYLEYGMETGVNLRSNCKNRNPWYGCEVRDIPPILVSYMGRNNNRMLPIRFILNKAGATATNSYLMLYPRKEFKHLFASTETAECVWKILSAISKDTLLAHGRCYGGGLLKWEPRELESVPCPELGEILKPLSPSLFDSFA